MKKIGRLGRGDGVVLAVLEGAGADEGDGAGELVAAGERDHLPAGLGRAHIVDAKIKGGEAGRAALLQHGRVDGHAAHVIE